MGKSNRRKITELAERIHNSIRGALDPRVKDSIARRVSEMAATAVIGNRLSAWSPMHETAMRLAWNTEKIPLEVSRKLWVELCSVLLRGQVIPLQHVRQYIDEATDWYLGMCICRQSERVRDLYRAESNAVYLAGPEEKCRPYLDRFLDTYLELQREGDVYTSDALKVLLSELVALRKRGDAAYGTGLFWEKTHPYFEILLNHPDFIEEWRETMGKNKRLWRFHPRLLKEWVNLAYFTRGSVFTSMTMVDARYTICTCPGPENDKGCILYNWHFYSGNEAVLSFNEDQAHGQLKDGMGRVLSCKRFAARRDKACFGCGCDHQEEGSELPETLKDPRPELD